MITTLRIRTEILAVGAALLLSSPAEPAAAANSVYQAENPALQIAGENPMTWSEVSFFLARPMPYWSDPSIVGRVTVSVQDWAPSTPGLQWSLVSTRLSAETAFIIDDTSCGQDAFGCTNLIQYAFINMAPPPANDPRFIPQGGGNAYQAIFPLTLNVVVTSHLLTQSDAAQRRVIDHEIGHVYGLDDLVRQPHLTGMGGPVILLGHAVRRAA